MARQIAHEIKNPLTPMKLNIQFMMRTIDMEDTDKFKQRFRSLSGMLIEQIDNMAATASAFSDFAKISLTRNEVLKLDEVLRNCIMLFDHTIADIRYEGDPDLAVFADREQMRRVIVNLLKTPGKASPKGVPEKSMSPYAKSAGASKSVSATTDAASPRKSANAYSSQTSPPRPAAQAWGLPFATASSRTSAEKSDSPPSSASAQNSTSSSTATKNRMLKKSSLPHGNLMEKNYFRAPDRKIC